MCLSYCEETAAYLFDYGIARLALLWGRKVLTNRPTGVIIKPRISVEPRWSNSNEALFLTT